MIRAAAAVVAMLGCAFAAPAWSAVTQCVSGARVVAVADAALRALPANADAVPVLERSIADQQVAAGEVALTARTPIATPYFIDVPVAIEVGGVERRVVYVGYRVQRYVRTAVAARDLAPGNVLTAEDLTMARVPYSGRESNGDGVLVGRRIAAAVRAGDPIFVEQTQANQIVKAGSSVVLVVRDAGVALTADAVARSNGALGDEVSVYNPSTDKTLSGTVVAPNQVELDIELAEDMP